MSNKTSAIRIRLDPQLHKNFLEACNSVDRPAAQVIREFMKLFIEQNPSVKQDDLFEE